jgi:hypothetical protein
LHAPEFVTVGIDPGALNSQLGCECRRIDQAPGDGRGALASDQLDHAARECFNERLVKTAAGKWREASRGLCAVSHRG